MPAARGTIWPKITWRSARFWRHLAEDQRNKRPHSTKNTSYAHNRPDHNNQCHRRHQCEDHRSGAPAIEPGGRVVRYCVPYRYARNEYDAQKEFVQAELSGPP